MDSFLNRRRSSITAAESTTVAVHASDPVTAGGVDHLLRADTRLTVLAEADLAYCRRDRGDRESISAPPSPSSAGLGPLPGSNRHRGASSSATGPG